MKHDVFISFSFQDQKQAEEIVNILSSKYGISCWICTRDIDGGKRFKSLILEAIDAAKVVVFIQSENSLASKEIPREIGNALDADKTIIPFRIDSAQPHGDLRYDLYGVEYIDATVPSFDDRVADLARSIIKVLGKDRKSQTVSNSSYQLKSNRVTCSEIFYGRDDILNEINEAFKTRNVVFLCGMGGIGKSEIAKQYARRFNELYDTVIFARYEDGLVSLLADDSIFTVTRLIRKHKEDGNLQSDEEYASIKLDIIKSLSNERTLIIIDNFDVFSDPMLRALTDNIEYRVIFTSRCEPERGKYHVIPVAELDDETLRDMVVDFANPNTSMIDRDDPAFPELFALTNRHTLTLELIAKYMDEKGIDYVEEMVKILKEQRLYALSDSAEVDRYASIRNLFHMTDLNEQEKTFLRCLAMMPPSGVLQRNFRKWCGDNFAARAHLVKLSLIKLDNAAKTISLHPIVRQVILSDLKPDYQNCKEFLDRFADEIDERFSWNWSLDEKKAALNCADEIITCVSELTEETFNLYYKIIAFKNFVQEYSMVIPLHRRLYAFACETYGEDSFNAGTVAFRAGWLCKKFLMLDEATYWLEEKAYPALKKNEEAAFIEYPHCGTNLAILYIKKYELSGDEENLIIAEKYISESDSATCANYETAYKNNDEITSNIMYQRIAGVRMEQAELSMKKGDYAAAQRALDEAKEILTGYADLTADIAYLTLKYSSMYYSMGKYTLAIETLNKANELCEQVFSTENDCILSVYVMLARCYEKIQESDRALQAWKKALEIADASLVKEHPTLITIKKHLNGYL